MATKDSVRFLLGFGAASALLAGCSDNATGVSGPYVPGMALTASDSADIAALSAAICDYAIDSFQVQGSPPDTLYGWVWYLPDTIAEGHTVDACLWFSHEGWTTPAALDPDTARVSVNGWVSAPRMLYVLERVTFVDSCLIDMRTSNSVGIDSVKAFVALLRSSVAVDTGMCGFVQTPGDTTLTRVCETDTVDVPLCSVTMFSWEPAGGDTVHVSLSVPTSLYSWTIYMFWYAGGHIGCRGIGHAIS